jgi:mono/diheme cytochrome c family protein
MKNVSLIVVGVSLFFFTSCGGGENNEKQSDNSPAPPPPSSASADKSKSDESDSKENKGIGPVKSIELGDIDQSLAEEGKSVFVSKCSACHKMDKNATGPALSGVTDRRSPEWIMNMILNPEVMIKEDPIAKKLLIENNMAMMANQNLTEDEARQILEYFRQNDNK